MNFPKFFDNIYLIVSQIGVNDVIDLFLVWVVVYRVLILTKRSGAVQILSGMGFLAIAYLLSIWLELMTFNWLLERFFSHLFLIVVILFQAEIRRALAQFGSNPLFLGESQIEARHVIEEIAQGAVQLAQKGVGALIVIEKEIVLDYFIEEGVEMDSVVTAEVINSIFTPSSPLHDGALIVRNGRLNSAGCFLPLSKNPVLDKNLGTRHRAAIGLTEETDALVLVVSEENSSVGLVYGGQLIPDLDHATLRSKLYSLLKIKKKNSKEGA